MHLTHIVIYSLLIFHCGKELIRRGIGPFFYCSKVESYHEARLWNQLFSWAEGRLGLGKVRMFHLSDAFVTCVLLLCWRCPLTNMRSPSLFVSLCLMCVHPECHQGMYFDWEYHSLLSDGRNIIWATGTFSRTELWDLGLLRVVHCQVGREGGHWTEALSASFVLISYALFCLYVLCINRFAHRRDMVFPDRTKYVNMKCDFMQSYMRSLVDACHRRGAPATTGMAGLVTDPSWSSDVLQVRRSCLLQCY